MNKPAFDPNQPFEASKPAFDPNAPFTAGDQGQTPPQYSMLNHAADISQRAQDAVLGPLGRASDTAARGFSNLAFGSELPAQYAEQGLGMVGKGIQKLGEGVAGGIGYAAQKLAPAGVNPDVMKYTDYGAAAAGTALSQIPSLLVAPEVGKSQVVQDAAQNLGRRSLGFSKGILNRLKGGIPEANQVAQTMLDEGVIKPFSGAKATLGRAEDLAATSGKEVGGALASAGQNAMDTNQVSRDLIDQLAPKYQGGAYDAQEKVANEIVDTVMAHGNGPIDFQKAQELKNTLKQMAGNNWNTDKMKAGMYQRAYGIVSDALEKGVSEAPTLPIVQPGAKTGAPHAIFTYNDKFGPGGAERSIYNVFGDPNNPVLKTRGWGSSVPKEDLDKLGIPIAGRAPGSEKFQPIGIKSQSDKYIQNKQLYGASQKAIRGLEDKTNREASNNMLSLRGAAIGAGALATGHVTPALEALGLWEAAQRVGSGTGAYALNALNSPISQGAKRAALAAFIDKVTTK